MKILIAYFSAEKKRTASVALSLKEFLADKVADSGGSGIGKTAEKLKPYLKGALTVEARLTQTASELKSWAINQN